MEAADFLRALIEAVPYRIHIVLTDNGIQFTARKQDIWDSTHIFDRVCHEHGIEHRLTKVNHPWTTDVIDKSFFASAGVVSSGARVTLWQRAGFEV
jgi:transposase InsO family protein